jgi:nitrogen fixation/metabolism regulation signal transduction histidine kinase
LAIVKKIVDDHDGTLIIRNSKDKNAVVEMILPLDLNHQNSNI